MKGESRAIVADHINNVFASMCVHDLLAAGIISESSRLWRTCARKHMERRMEIRRSVTGAMHENRHAVDVCHEIQVPSTTKARAMPHYDDRYYLLPDLR